MENNKKKKFAYGWLIVIGAMLMQAVVFGVASNMHPQFTKYVVEGENFQLATFSLMFTIGTVVSAIASPFIGKSYNKFPIKLIYLVGTIVATGGVMFMSVANKYWMFYVGYSLAQTGVSAVASLGVPTLINAWFDENSKGKALGLAFAGGSIGNIFLQTLSVQLIVNHGYKTAYLIFGLVGLIVGGLVSLLIIRFPKDSSEIVKGKSKEETKEENKEEEKWGYTLGEVSKMKVYWMYAFGFIFIGLYVSALAMQFPVYLNTILDPTMVGAVGSVFAFFSLIGNIAGGALFDKLGAFKTMLLSGVLVALACISLILAKSIPAFAFAFAVCKGLSLFGYMLGPSFLVGSLFGNKDFGAILAISNLFFAVGVASGTPLFGLFVELFDYTTAWAIILGFIVLAYTCILSAIKTMNKINKEKLGR